MEGGQRPPYNYLFYDEMILPKPEISMAGTSKAPKPYTSLLNSSFTSAFLITVLIKFAFEESNL